MDRAAAEKLAARLSAEHVDRASRRFFVRRDADGSWSVASMLLPEELRKAPLRIQGEHGPVQAFAEDGRTGHESRIPGLPGGIA